MTTRFIDHLLTGTHAARPAATAVPQGTLYSCSTDSLIYQSTGTIWSTYATLGGALADHDHTVAGDGGNLSSAVVDGKLIFNEAAAPSTPGAATVALYAKADGRVYSKDDAGVEYGPFDAAGGGGGNISGQVGGASINIPRLQGDPDQIPGSPNANDREFDSATLAGTAVGTATAENADTLRKSCYYVKKTGNGTILVTGRAWAWTPSNGDHVTVRQLALFGGATTRSGLFIGTATPGAMDSIGFGASTNYGYYHDAWTSPTAYGSTPGSALFGSIALNFHWAIPTYFRIVYNSSTSIDTQYSWEPALGWNTIVAARNPGYTVGSFGLMVEPTGSVDAMGLWDWIRVNWTP